jgi:hypothetical protein
MAQNVAQNSAERRKLAQIGAIILHGKAAKAL